jgi:tetratricopeptide (TPR) repeat protein
MNRTTGVLFAVLVANPVWGVARQGQSTAANSQRLQSIWNAASDRVTEQNDLWFKEGDFPRVIQLLRFSWEIDTSDYDVATNLGWMLENVENYPAALEVYTRYKALNPHDPDRTFPEAYYYFEKKQYATVAELLEPVLPERPGPNAFRLLANTYTRLHRYKDSVRVWKDYIKIAPKDGAAKMNLAREEKRAAQGG